MSMFVASTFASRALSREFPILLESKYSHDHKSGAHESVVMIHQYLSHEHVSMFSAIQNTLMPMSPRVLFCLIFMPDRKT